MKTKLFAALIFPIAAIFANENPKPHSEIHRQPSIISQIVTQQPDSIEYDDGEKLYLKAEKIFRTDKGLFLRNGDSCIFMPSLSIDHIGYYISRSRKNINDYYFRCPNPDCGERWWFSETWSDLCPVCRTPGE